MHLSSLCRSYEGTLDGDMTGAGDLYYWGAGAPLAQGERGSLASLDSTLRKGPGPSNWRQPELPEVIAMLNYRLDPVRSNAAAYLQHLTYKNDKVRLCVQAYRFSFKACVKCDMQQLCVCVCVRMIEAWEQLGQSYRVKHSWFLFETVSELTKKSTHAFSIPA